MFYVLDFLSKRKCGKYQLKEENETEQAFDLVCLIVSWVAGPCCAVMASVCVVVPSCTREQPVAGLSPKQRNFSVVHVGHPLGRPRSTCIVGLLE